MKVIIFNNPETGYISILYPANERNASEEQILEECIQKLNLQDTEYIAVDKDCVPNLDVLTHCLKLVEHKLVLDITKVDKIVKSQWRIKREPILKRLDVEFMKALENGDNDLSKEIASKKKILRDVTSSPLPSRTDSESLEQYCNRLLTETPDCLSI